MSRRLFLFTLLLIAGLLLLYAFFDIPGRFFYERRSWDIPTDGQQKAAYDYAHSLKLPDSVPKLQPFNFPLARLKALVPGQPDVSTQYFNHLCSTESGEYIFKIVENVEGIFQMRPRGQVGDTSLDFDRYALEEPTGVGWSNDEGTDDQVYEMYIQPMLGKYTFMERPNPDDPSTIIRAVREVNLHPPKRYRNNYSTFVRIRPGLPRLFNLPWMVTYKTADRRQARYGFTWRGIQRESDRRYSIGAGEYLIVDMNTNEVLAVKRRFKQSGYDRNTNSRIWWSNARSCENEIFRMKGFTPAPIPITDFIEVVLHSIPHVNDQFIPEEIKREIQKEQQK